MSKKDRLSPDDEYGPVASLALLFAAAVRNTIFAALGRAENS